MFIPAGGSAKAERTALGILDPLKADANSHVGKN